MGRKRPTFAGRFHPVNTSNPGGARQPGNQFNSLFNRYHHDIAALRLRLDSYRGGIGGYYDCFYLPYDAAASHTACGIAVTDDAGLAGYLLFTLEYIAACQCVFLEATAAVVDLTSAFGGVGVSDFGHAGLAVLLGFAADAGGQLALCIAGGVNAGSARRDLRRNCSHRANGK